MAATIKVAELETWLAAPPPSTVSDLSLSLKFSDMVWMLLTSPIHCLIFYESPISKNHFIGTIIPKLKNSISLALQHFPSLAGNLIIPHDSSRAEICYVNGDSVPIVFAESSLSNFDDLVSDKPRNCSEFYAFVPQLPQSSKSSGSTKVPLLALQVTLFPNIGICIGISNQHVAGDGSSMYAFVKAWAEISKLGEDSLPADDESLPFYDRDVMPRYTKELDEMLWKFVKDGLDNNRIDFDQVHGLPADADKVRATFAFGLDDVKRLENYVSAQQSSLKHLSKFTVVCGYVWLCLVKAGNAITDTAADDETEYFGSAADCRGRTDPPIPPNYFGNCLTYFFATAKNRRLSTGMAGLPIAADLIGEAIHQRLQNKDGPFKDFETIFSDLTSINMERVVTVAGSPRQNYYHMDFGWGKPRKFEFVSIDSTGALSLCGSREPGGIEVGLSMPKAKMDAFVTIFNEGLQAL